MQARWLWPYSRYDQYAILSKLLFYKQDNFKLDPFALKRIGLSLFYESLIVHLISLTVENKLKIIFSIQ
jgi:hypothetical protein